MLPLPYWITVLATIIAVVVSVILHYEGLRFLSDKLPMPKRHHRRRIILLILCLMLLHSIEIWIFGLNYFWLQNLQGFGAFVDIEHLGVFDCVYYSASVFTTLGFGDIVTEGPIPLYDWSRGGIGADVHYLVRVVHFPGNAEDLEPRGIATIAGTVIIE